MSGGGLGEDVAQVGRRLGQELPVVIDHRQLRPRGSWKPSTSGCSRRAPGSAATTDEGVATSRGSTVAGPRSRPSRSSSATGWERLRPRAGVEASSGDSLDPGAPRWEPSAGRGSGRHLGLPGWASGAASGEARGGTLPRYAAPLTTPRVPRDRSVALLGGLRAVCLTGDVYRMGAGGAGGSGGSVSPALNGRRRSLPTPPSLVLGLVMESSRKFRYIGRIGADRVDPR